MMKYVLDASVALSWVMPRPVTRYDNHADRRPISCRGVSQMSEPFKGFDSLKQEHPSAEHFCIYIPAPEDQSMGMPSWFGLSLHVNSIEFEGYPPEAVLFCGAHASSADPFQRLHFVFCQEGWNTAFHPELRKWLRIQHAQTGQRPYPSADLSPLVANKVDVTKGYGEIFTGVQTLPATAPVQVALAWHHSKDAPPTLAVRVTNLGADPLSKLTVSLSYENEVPQPGQLTPNLKYQGVGGAFGLAKQYLFDGTLQRGLSTTFCLPPFMIEHAQSLVAALSPERYRLTILADEQPIAVVDGSMLGEFFDTNS